MSAPRSCHWMSGPTDVGLKLSSIRWWLAISRGVLGKAVSRHAPTARPPVKCQRTPTFVSPLGERRL